MIWNKCPKNIFVGRKTLEARAKKPYNTLQKVSSQLELPNLRNHVCCKIAYFADLAVFWSRNMQKIKNVYFVCLLVLSYPIPFPYKKYYFKALFQKVVYFHMYHLNDLRYSLKYTTSHFADDTSIIYASKSQKTLESNLNYDLKSVTEWLKSNRLSLNVGKTKLLIFHSKKKSQFNDISIKIPN